MNRERVEPFKIFKNYRKVPAKIKKHRIIKRIIPQRVIETRKAQAKRIKANRKTQSSYINQQLYQIDRIVRNGSELLLQQLSKNPNQNQFINLQDNSPKDQEDNFENREVQVTTLFALDQSDNEQLL